MPDIIEILKRRLEEERKRRELEKRPINRIKTLLKQRESATFLRGSIRLEKGDLFQAKGGPYYLNEYYVGGGWWDVERITMAFKGPFTFVGTYRDDKKRLFIKAYNKTGFCLLNLEEMESSCLSTDSMIGAPYVVTGRVKRKRRPEKNPHKVRK